MVTKPIEVKIGFNPELVKNAAELTESQISSILNQQSPRLRKDLIYVVPKQVVHVEQLPQAINGREFSNRVFVLGFNAEGTLVEIVSLSINGLRQTHYGPTDNPLRVEAEIRGGLHRIPRGAVQQYSVFSVGSFPIHIQGKNALIPRDFAFKVNGRVNCYTANFVQLESGVNEGKWDMVVDSEGDKEYIRFSTQNFNDYVEIDNIPAFDLTAVLEANPKMKDFIA